MTFDESDPLEGSSSTPTYIDPQMGREEEVEDEEEDICDEFVDLGMKEDY